MKTIETGFNEKPESIESTAKKLKDKERLRQVLKSTPFTADELANPPSTWAEYKRRCDATLALWEARLNAGAPESETDELFVKHIHATSQLPGKPE